MVRTSELFRCIINVYIICNLVLQVLSDNILLPLGNPAVCVQAYIEAIHNLIVISNNKL